MSAFCSRFRENPRMPQQQESTIVAQSDAANDLVLALIKDATELTPREFELERKAAIEEVKKRSWLGDTAQQITRRVPVSVFAMGDLAAAA